MKLGNYKHNYSALGYIVFVLMCVSACFQQANSQQLLWQRVFDSGLNDFVRAVCTDSFGNIIVTGSVARSSTSDALDWLTIKYDANGDTIWTRRFCQYLENRAYAVASDRWNNIIVAGGIVNTTGYEYCTVKYDSQGNILWTRTFRTNSDLNWANGVAVDSKGNVIVAGMGIFSLSYDYVTIKYDSVGNIIWVRSYDGGYEDIATAVTVDDSDNVIVTGYSNRNINWDWCTVKYNAYGDKLWIARYDSTIDDWAQGVATDKAGNVFVVGFIHVSSDPHLTATIRKYSAIGQVLWTKTYSWIGNFVSVQTNIHGDIFLGGWYYQLVSQSDDYITMKCNSQGDTLWTSVYDGGYTDLLFGVTVDKSGNVIVTGVSYDGFPHGQPPGQPNYVTIKYRDTLTGTGVGQCNNCHPSIFSLQQNYPNPFNASTVIKFSIMDKNNFELRIYDVLGKRIKKFIFDNCKPDNYEVVWDGTDDFGNKVSSGVYFYNIISNYSSQTKRMMLIR